MQRLPACTGATIFIILRLVVAIIKNKDYSKKILPDGNTNMQADRIFSDIGSKELDMPKRPIQKTLSDYETSFIVNHTNDLLYQDSLQPRIRVKRDSLNYSSSLPSIHRGNKSFDDLYLFSQYAHGKSFPRSIEKLMSQNIYTKKTFVTRRPYLTDELQRNINRAEYFTILPKVTKNFENPGLIKMDNLVQRNFGKKFADVFKNYLHKPLVSSMQKQRGKRTKRKAPTYAMNVAVGNSSHNASKEFPEQTEVANSNFRNNHLSWNINQDNLKNKNEKVVISQNNTTQIQDKENTMREIRSRGADSLGMYIESELFLNEEGIPHNANAIKKLKKRELSQNEYGTKFLPHKIETDQQKKSSSQLEDSVESSVNSCIRKTGDQGTNPIYRGNESKVYARTHDVLTVPIPDTRRKIRRKSKRSERRSNRAVKSIEEIKAFAEKLVAKVNELQHYLTENDTGRPDRGKKRSATGAVQVSSTLSRATTEKRSKISERCVPSRNVSFICSQNLDSELVNTANRGKTKIKRKRVAKQKARSVGREQWKRRSAFGTPSVKPSTIERRDSKKAKRRRKWGRWTDWSSCSVTCGKGRQIRWRYCLHNCTIAETEMEEKACQLPACPPGKFLGIF